MKEKQVGTELAAVIGIKAIEDIIKFVSKWVKNFWIVLHKMMEMILEVLLAKMVKTIKLKFCIEVEAL